MCWIFRRNALCRCACGLACLLMSGAIAPALAGDAADKAAIARRLQHWAEAFNARDAAASRDLFAPDLIATIRGLPERGRAAVCAQLATALADRNKRMRYVPDIREIIVSGDLALVRLVWTLTVQSGSLIHRSEEPGIDIFRRRATAAGQSSASRRSRPTRTDFFERNVEQVQKSAFGCCCRTRSSLEDQQPPVTLPPAGPPDAVDGLALPPSRSLVPLPLVSQGFALPGSVADGPLGPLGDIDFIALPPSRSLVPLVWATDAPARPTDNAAAKRRYFMTSSLVLFWRAVNRTGFQ